MWINIGLNNACCVCVYVFLLSVLCLPAAIMKNFALSTLKAGKWASFKCCTFNIYQTSIRIYAHSNRQPPWSIALLNYGATRRRGGNSLLLRAISLQNKNISFPQKSQINTGFAWSGFYLPKKCYFLTHFVYGMKDGSRELSKMSFMHAHTHSILLHCRFLSCSLCLVVSHTHRHTQSSYICAYAVYTHAKAFVFRTFVASKGPSESDGWLCRRLLDVTVLLCWVFTSMAYLPRLISPSKTLEQFKGQQWIS